jgi:Tol biopolymer transport system component
MPARIHTRRFLVVALACTAVLAGITAAVSAQGLTTIASSPSPGVFGDAPSHDIALSADGRFLAFTSEATNLLPAPTGANSKILVLDRATGIMEHEDLAASGSTGWPSAHPAISADGRFVAFDKYTDHLGTGNQAMNVVYVRDRQTGVIENITAAPGMPGVYAEQPSLSGDGRYVAYTARDVITAGAQAFQVYVHDRVTGTKVLVSADQNGAPASRDCSTPLISRDGRWVAFTSAYANDLVPSDTNLSQPDIFVRDLQLGVTTLVSVSTGGVQSDSANTLAGISADGRYVAFSSDSQLLAPAMVPYWELTFVRDTLLGTTTVVSHTPAGGVPSHTTRASAMSGDGRFVLFHSDAVDIVPSALAPGVWGVFAWDRATGAVSLASAGTDGQPFSSGSAYNGALSDDGRVFAFEFASASQIAVHDRTISFASTFCAGGVTCPCGNNGSHGAGCENSFGTGGARLAASGNASVTTDAFVLHADEMPPTTAVLFFQGTSKVNNGAGSVFGDGLLCAGGTVMRLGAKSAVNGSAVYGGPVGDIPISVRGAVTYGGLKRYYQAWYRNVDPGYCTASPFNLTNGVEMHWAF